MDDVIRIGRVSSVSGNSVRVTYQDRDGTVTEELPVFSNGVYRIPGVGEVVVVAHMSNGTTGGICLGGLAQSGMDYLLSALYLRLKNIEDRLDALEGRATALEDRADGFDEDISSLDERVTALGG